METDKRGWLTFDGYINLWVLNVSMNITQAMEHFAYLGFNVDNRSQLDAITVTRDRRTDIAEKCTERKVFQCHVIGPKDAGKTVFCHSLVGKGIQVGGCRVSWPAEHSCSSAISLFRTLLT